MRTKYRLGFFTLALILPFFVATSGNREGNGGDYVRPTFMRMGRAVLKYLRVSPTGREIVRQHNLRLDDLEATLTIERVKLRKKGELVDNGDSKVDAIGDKLSRLIRLDNTEWLEHFDKNRDVYFMVFHEMLRASDGPNDDDYIVSNKILPFPEEYKIVTSLREDEPLVHWESLSTVIAPEKVVVEGSGCPIGQGLSAFVEFDRENNIVEITPLNYRVQTMGAILDQRAACNFIIPISPGPNQQVVVTQIDVVSSVFLMNGAVYRTKVESYIQGTIGETRHSGVVADATPTVGKSLMRVSDILATPCAKATSLNLHTSASVAGTTLHPSQGNVMKIKVYLRSKHCMPRTERGPRNNTFPFEP